MLGKQPTVPLAFYESELDKWRGERQTLLNRIQHPNVIHPTTPPVGDLPDPDFSESEQLAKVGTVEYEDG